MLGVAPSDGYEAVHDRYRRLMRTTHPDVAGSGSDAEARQVTAAFAEVRRAHDAGELPAPEPVPEPSTPVAVRREPDVLYLRLPGDDPFLQLLEAAHGLGEITYQDANAGLFMVLLDEPGEACCQLTGEMRTVDGVTSVQFSLEPMGPGPVPPITSIVRRFGALSRTD